VVLATHSIRQFPLHFPSRASPCAITFQLESNMYDVTDHYGRCVRRLSLLKYATLLLPGVNDREKKFPTITKLAYFIHGIQASSATSERSFSTKGRVIQDRRTSKTQLTTLVFLNSVLPKQTRKLEIKYFILLLKSAAEFAELYCLQSFIFDSAWCSADSHK